jgi:hypothetical protein
MRTAEPIDQRLLRAHRALGSITLHNKDCLFGCGLQCSYALDACPWHTEVAFLTPQSSVSREEAHLAVGSTR